MKSGSHLVMKTFGTCLFCLFLKEAALERLYRWTQSHCRSLESSESAVLLTQAMACLQDRPVLFK